MPSTIKLFKKYKKDHNFFIETGSHIGQGIQNAIDADFNHIYSIELSEKWYDFCKKKFSEEFHVLNLFGDSAKVLPTITNTITESIFFWLDGHYSGGDTAGKDLKSPLYDELETIKNHPVKTHTILIDDIRGEDIEKLIAVLQDINPEYKFYYEDSIRNGELLFKNDILVATL